MALTIFLPWQQMFCGLIGHVALEVNGLVSTPGSVLLLTYLVASLKKQNKIKQNKTKQKQTALKKQIKLFEILDKMFFRKI